MTDQQIINGIIECMNLQSRTNSLVNPDWKKANYNWRRAMWIEAAELTDLVGYKWWKDLTKEPNQKQILLEVVDIFHFLLSDILLNNRYSANDVYNSLKWAKTHHYAPTREDKIRQIEEFVAVCLDGHGLLHPSFFQLMHAVDVRIEDLLKYYLGKNALNKFRQDNGYKDGSYRKQWNFLGNQVEDNVVLEHIMENGAVLKFDAIYDQLKTLYVTA